MKNDILFSIVVPVYKTEDYLERCVLSALAQTYKNIEIVLVDDGSPDGCPAICDRLAATDSRIKVIHKQNGGLSDARNAGIDAARGKYIIFLDSDDTIQPDTCEKLAPAVELSPDTVVGDWNKSDEPQRERRELEICAPVGGTEYIKKTLEGGRLRMAAPLYIQRRGFLNENKLRFKYGIRHEDDEFTPRALLAAKSVVVTNLIFYNYDIREDSITTQKDLRRNAGDLYSTCLELEKLYSSLEDGRLSALLRDTLSMKTLSLFQSGKLYIYGSEFIYRKLVLRNARRTKTRLKAWLYCISPRLYWHINAVSKKI